jgi:addiction module RelE/StbE family toxin
LTWEAFLTPTFRRGYKNLGPEIQKRIDDAITELMQSDNPALIAIRKIGKWKGVYTYEIGKRYRIFYTVQFEQRTICFLDVGGHEIY